MTTAVATLKSFDMASGLDFILILDVGHTRDDQMDAAVAGSMINDTGMGFSLGFGSGVWVNVGCCLYP